MNKKIRLAMGFGLLFLMTSAYTYHWGFFGHKRINRLAVFTLPTEIMGFYKKHIEYITNHAPDPDKRRYATKHEAHRHYIDLDQWGVYPFEELPRYFDDALLKYSSWELITEAGDTFALFENADIIQYPSFYLNEITLKEIFEKDSFALDYQVYRNFFKSFIKTQYYEDEWLLEPQLLDSLGLKTKIPIKAIQIKDNFSEHGILPYHLNSMLYKLTKAFEAKDQKRILQLSADFGHYIGDAHVPLHTTKNYNGQLTNQVGIHAFWESRLPELFADAEYDFFVGPADYIDEPLDYFWNIVLESHVLVDSVLQIEKRLSETFPSDEQYCYEKRGDFTLKMPCKAYAKAFHKALEGMVEDRMRASILATGSVWYTAWVNAGMPDLSEAIISKEPIEKKEENTSKHTQNLRNHDY